MAFLLFRRVPFSYLRFLYNTSGSTYYDAPEKAVYWGLRTVGVPNLYQMFLESHSRIDNALVPGDLCLGTLEATKPTCHEEEQTGNARSFLAKSACDQSDCPRVSWFTPRYQGEILEVPASPARANL